jgi:hypothetical protein
LIRSFPICDVHDAVIKLNRQAHVLNSTALARCLK